MPTLLAVNVAAPENIAMMIYPLWGLAHQRGNPATPFGITGPDRLLHCYVFGQTGTGKSTLLKNVIYQDVALGNGVCVLDPHGDLVADLHERLPSGHLYWDVADPTCQLGYNPIQRVDASLRPLVASGLIDALKKQWPDAWGARMEHLLRHAVLALLEQPRADLRDLMKLFVYKGFRRQVTEGLSDPQVRFFWKHEFPNLNYQTSADGVSPIANKLGAFLAHPAVRLALCEPKHPLRFRQIMDRRQTLLVNLAKGRLGADVSNVLGGLISASLLNAAFTRHDTPEHKRTPYYLFVDEFQNLTTHAFAGMLPEARKYGVGLTLAHQYLSQLGKETRDAVIGNVGNTVLFRVGAQDAPFFERLVPPFTAFDLQNQRNRRAVALISKAGERLRPFTMHTLPSDRRSEYPSG